MPTNHRMWWPIRHFKRLYLLLNILLLAACQQTPAVRMPPPTPEILRVQYTPALRAWVAALNRCANDLPLAGLVVNETPANRLDLAASDIALRFGPAASMPASVLQLGMDELVLIVNPANPLLDANLEPGTVSSIYSGQTVQWGDLIKGQTQAIQVWSFLPGDDLRQVFEAAFLGGQSLTAHAYLAPDTASMLEAVAREPAAIGYLLKSQLDKTVRQLSLNGQPVSDLRQPILALVKGEPQGNLRQLLLCLGR
jgi:hypothetical protein